MAEVLGYDGEYAESATTNKKKIEKVVATLAKKVAPAAGEETSEALKHIAEAIAKVDELAGKWRANFRAANVVAWSGEA